VGAGSDHPFGLALAPDGRRLAYPAARQGLVSLWLQDLSSGDARSLPSTDGAAAPFWSPDGTRIGFLAAGRVRAIDLASGSISDLAEAPFGRGGAWNEAGDLVFAPGGASGLMRRTADGAIARRDQVGNVPAVRQERRPRVGRIASFAVERRPRSWRFCPRVADVPA